MTARFLCLSVVVLFATLSGGAQEQPGNANNKDPRVGLKAGFRDAGEAAMNMERLSSVPKPQGFYDPKLPAGEPTPPERNRDANAPAAAAADPAAAEKDATAAAAKEEAAEKDPNSPQNDPRRQNRLSFANSDLAFRGNQLVMGSFHGFNTYDIENARRPRLIGSVVCPGGQGDVSIHGNLLFMSVEQTRGRIDCGTEGVPEKVSSERFRGIRIFDITDVKKPKQIAAIQTCRGSHTHTLVIDPDDKENIYVYGSGTGSVRPGDELAGCSGLDPKEDPNTALFSIDVIKVPLAAPATAKIVNRPRIFADPKSGAISGLWQGGDHGPGTQRSRMTNQCHDITVFPAVGLAAGACSGNGILIDISDPVHPVRLDHVVDKAFAYWHSATFNIDGTKVVFTDEWGGGTRPRCRATDPPTWGGDAIFDIVDRKLKFASYYKMPAPQTEQENCVAHNGSLIPVPGRDIMVQGWYQGGLSVFDFTESAKPVEIAFFDRGPIDAKQLITGGYWSTYWYNGRIYGTEIARGLDVLELSPSKHLTASEIAAAKLANQAGTFNPQQQYPVSWPDAPVVARAYIDQLQRDGGFTAANVATLSAMLDKAQARLDAGQKDAGVAAELRKQAGQLAGAQVGTGKAMLAKVMEAIAVKLK
jgi:hypothetical protein